MDSRGCTTAGEADSRGTAIQPPAPCPLRPAPFLLHVRVELHVERLPLARRLPVRRPLVMPVVDAPERAGRRVAGEGAEADHLVVRLDEGVDVLAALRRAAGEDAVALELEGVVEAVAAA